MWELRVVHVLVALILGPIIYRSWKIISEDNVNWLDVFMILAGIAASLYAIIEGDDLQFRKNILPTTGDIVFGTILLVLIIELTRRALGWPLVIIIFVFMGYSLVSEHLPGILKCRSYEYSQIISAIFSDDGYYGIPIGASATYVYLFIVFGAFLRASKVGDFFTDLAYSVAGRTRGGPAKVAVFASSLMGTISGSGVANVVTSGTLTIPLMKSAGFRSTFAGAVEAAASAGGQIMPPVMGVAAFLLAEMISVPYKDVVTAATIPALLYYMALFFMVDFEAARFGMKGLPTEELPVLKKVLLSWGHLMIPFLVLIYELLIKAASPIRAALWSILACFIVSWLRRESRIGFYRLLEALKNGAVGSLEVIIACSAAGIVVGLISLTGIGLKLSSGIISLSGGHLLPALVLTMIITIILSMGLPTPGAYVISAVVIGPALTKMGIDLIQAHMFIFYFACMSAITPPVSMCAYPAAGIAEANPVRVGFTAWRLALTAFIVPYFFVYAPSLLWQGNWTTIVWSTITALIGVISLAVGLSGWLVTSTTIWERGIFIFSALFFINPGILTDALAVITLVIGIVSQVIRFRKKRSDNVPALSDGIS
jgi:TRAP transporter 4TM/12TM fusion protein